MTAKWPKVRLGECVEQRKTPVFIEDAKTYRRVTVQLHARGIVPRDEVNGRDIKTKRQYVTRGNDLLVAEIDAKVGGYGIVPPSLADAIVSDHYFLYTINTKRLNTEYLRYWLQTPEPLKQIREFVKGALNYAAIRPKNVAELELPLPPLEEQRKLAEHLKRFTVRSQEAERTCQVIAQEQDDLLAALVYEISRKAPTAPMKDVAPLVRRPVTVDKTAEYPELGIRSFGRGTFHKPAIKGAELGTKRLFRIEPGDLLFSNVFAWEAAIAVAQPEDKDRFGSHRFITCVCDTTRVTANFLQAYFLTPEGLAQVRAASPGAAGRNRTLSLKKLALIQVPVPPLPAQQRFSAIQDRVNAARRLHTQTAAELQTLLPAILDKAFRGELKGNDR